HRVSFFLFFFFFFYPVPLPSIAANQSEITALYVLVGQLIFPVLLGAPALSQIYAIVPVARIRTHKRSWFACRGYSFISRVRAVIDIFICPCTAIRVKL